MTYPDLGGIGFRWDVPGRSFAAFSWQLRRLTRRSTLSFNPRWRAECTADGTELFGHSAADEAKAAAAERTTLRAAAKRSAPKAIDLARCEGDERAASRLVAALKTPAYQSVPSFKVIEADAGRLKAPGRVIAMSCFFCCMTRLLRNSRQACLA